ncbi:hypothetical protein [Kangiella sp. TOML190]|uniref:hypothetical protein n=1 Tax=Kangiella sp. TOML190 TaxID=2931351 RepID=UPI00203DF51A|nr:hypothetical protein [Kangiella sp. TOML190]
MHLKKISINFLMSLVALTSVIVPTGTPDTFVDVTRVVYETSNFKVGIQYNVNYDRLNAINICLSNNKIIDLDASLLKGILSPSIQETKILRSMQADKSYLTLIKVPFSYYSPNYIDGEDDDLDKPRDYSLEVYLDEDSVVKILVRDNNNYSVIKKIK